MCTLNGLKYEMLSLYLLGSYFYGEYLWNEYDYAKINVTYSYWKS